MSLIHEYETVYVSRADLSDDIQTEVLNKLLTTINTKGGEVLVEEKWGRRKLAYQINKQSYANYVLLDYVGPAELPAELERIIRLDDRFMRFLTVRIDEDINVDDVREAAQARHKRRVERMSAT